LPGHNAKQQIMINDKTTMPVRTQQVDGLTIRYADTGTADGPGILLTSPVAVGPVPLTGVRVGVRGPARVQAVWGDGFDAEQVAGG
jgi:hypothetical protein